MFMQIVIDILAVIGGFTVITTVGICVLFAVSLHDEKKGE